MANRTRSTSNPDDSIEKLIEKVCTSFSNQLKVDFNARFNKLEEQLNVMSATFHNLTSDVKDNKDAIVALDVNLDESNQRAKKNSLRFLGFMEKDGENVLETVVTFINATLKIQCSKRDIDSAFRLGKAGSVNKPRAILVTFALNWMRCEVFNAKKLLKASEFAIFEDLTKKHYDLLMSAKLKYGKNKVWSAGGNIYYWNDTESRKKLITV